MGKYDLQWLAVKGFKFQVKYFQVFFLWHILSAQYPVLWGQEDQQLRTLVGVNNYTVCQNFANVTVIVLVLSFGVKAPFKTLPWITTLTGDFGDGSASTLLNLILK